MTLIEQIKEDMENGTPGPWKWSTSCSWNRLSTRDKDGGVLCPFVNQYDRHPDLSVSERDMSRIARVPDMEAALLAAEELAEACGKITWGTQGADIDAALTAYRAATGASQ